MLSLGLAMHAAGGVNTSVNLKLEVTSSLTTITRHMPFTCSTCSLYCPTTGQHDLRYVQRRANPVCGLYFMDLKRLRPQYCEVYKHLLYSPLP